MNKRCIVNFSKGSWYERGQKRLEQSLRTHQFKGDMFSFKDENQINSPKHDIIPYAFKIYAIEKAVNRGYTSILWCDSSLYAIKPLEPIFDHIEEYGHMFFWDGWNCAQWTHDKMLMASNLSRDEAEKIPQMLSGFLGLDLTKEKSLIFLRKWKTFFPE